MKPRGDIPQETRKLQSRASDPSLSAWVSAHAGSGKTHVLSKRVIRLLLDGADPSRILCLTYTKAAAANMANRVFGDLARWTALTDDELASEIAELDGVDPLPGRLQNARRLFARALETPGGLKIQTIHAFCEAILHQFPLEANIAGHFELLDGRMEEALVAEARAELLSGFAGGDRDDLADAFAEVLARGGENGLDLLLGEIVRKRDPIRRFLDQTGGSATAGDLLLAEFGFDPADTPASIAASPWPLPGFASRDMAMIAEAALACDARRVLDGMLPNARLAFAETSDPVTRLRLMARAMLTSKGEPYAPDTLFKKAMRAQIPDLADRYSDAAALLLATLDRVALIEMLVATRAALRLADRLIELYERLKSGRGFLDFNDLIVRTLRLLSRPDAGLWVQFRLDKGIDHILVDEAQDTSPGQWAVITQLAGEFFAGKGARDDTARTVFAVGDEKQSIYSFQGAEPHAFAETRHFFQQRMEGAGRRFEPLRLTWSFRSTDDVLGAVDLVFEAEANRRGLTRDPEPIAHKAIRSGDPGYVEVWPSIGAQSVEEPDDWTQAIDHASAPAVVLAERIARTVRGWLASGEMIEGQGRRLTAGDVLVLVRKRDRFVHALSRAFKVLGVPVAGADRLDLRAHIAVKDLVAIGRFVLQPADDLSLAALLKSPIFDLGEDRLFDLAHGRAKGVSLWESLQTASAGDPALGPIVGRLSAWRAEADLRPVFEFYAGILARDGVRRMLLARLGHEAAEIIDEYLAFCLAEERTGLPGLEAFLATLDGSGLEIKREMDQNRDEVRIMTVHASKGLEAPVVFLVDSGGAPFSSSHLPRLAAFEPVGGHWNGKGFLWRASADLANSVSRRIEGALQEKSEEEYRRLLYVAMTRAEDRLIVCGYHGARGTRPGAWHGVVEEALARSPSTIERGDPVSGEAVRRYRITPERPAAPPPADPPADRASPPRPDWLDRAPPPAPPLPRPLSPSGVSTVVDSERPVDAATAASPVLDPHETSSSLAIARGVAVHRLLQMLPETPAAGRPEAARRYLAQFGADWPDGARDAVQASVFSVLDDPRFAPVFAEGSRAEVAVMGTLRVAGRERMVSAKIDRLHVAPDRVRIVDYKTGRPPEGPGDVPPSYVAQLALYRDLLGPIYPGRRVEAALLFTEAPVLLALPDAALDAALAGLAAT